MRTCYVLLVLVLTANGCGGDDPSGPAAAQIVGQWSFTESYTDTPLAITCNNQATVTLVQNGSNFTGTSVQTGTCTDRTGGFDNSGNLQLRNGRVDGSDVSWDDDGDPVCKYTGTISGTPPNRMSGTVQCTGVVSGVNFDLRGMWQMTR